jgi:hypothetical protein
VNEDYFETALSEFARPGAIVTSDSSAYVQHDALSVDPRLQLPMAGKTMGGKGYGLWSPGRDRL